MSKIAAISNAARLARIGAGLKSSAILVWASSTSSDFIDGNLARLLRDFSGSGPTRRVTFILWFGCLLGIGQSRYEQEILPTIRLRGNAYPAQCTDYHHGP